MGLVVGLLSAFMIFMPSITTFARWQVRPGQAVQVISLVGTVSGRSTRNTASYGQGTSTIAIVAGDNGVHKSQINNTAMLIQSTSTRILRQSLGKLPTN